MTTQQQPAAQGLVPARVVEGEIVDANTYNTQVATWRDSGFNVLTPAVAISSLPRDHKIVVSRVSINPDPSGGEVYQNPLFTRGDEVALSKVGLEKLAQCAGISIDEIERVDSGTVPHVYRYRVYGHWIGFDGARIDRVAGKTLDLRDGSPEIKGFKDNQIEQARRHAESVCESKAINRLYRQYGVKQKFTKGELRDRPFIVLKLQWVPDMTNPIVAALVTQMNMGSTRLLYPQGMPLDPAALPPHQVPPEMRPRGEAQDDEGDDDEPTVSQQDESDEPYAPRQSEPVFHVTAVRRKAGGGFFVLTKETGTTRLLTDEERVADAAHKAIDGVPVTIDLITSNGETWIEQLATPKKDSGY